MPGSTPEGAAMHVRSYAHRAEAHAHDFHQVVLPVAGCLELEIAGRGGRVMGATGALVPAGERHAFLASSRNAFLVLDLPHAVLEETGSGAWLDRTRRGCFFTVSRASARLVGWYAEELAQPEAPPAMAAAFAALFLGSARRGEARTVPGAVARALALIDARALLPLSASDVARAAGVSVGHLHALFRTHVGRAPLAVVRARRLDEARRLLERTDLPIGEVALRCGFGDQAALAHAVRRTLGTTPGRLRRPRS